MAAPSPGPTCTSRAVKLHAVNQPFVPPDSQVPESLETERFRLRPLTIHDVVKDYDAMISRGNVTAGLTLEQNLIDLGWHQKEFQRRSSFTYTVMAPDENRCLGCVYLYPSRVEDAGADIYLWVRGDSPDLLPDLSAAVRAWVDRDWCFDTVRYPGLDP